MINGIRNLIKWFKVIWGDVDYDYRSIYSVIEFKLNDIAKHISSHQMHVGWERDVERLNTCKRLVQRVKDSYYEVEMMDYYESDIDFIPITGSNSYEGKFRFTKNNLHLYIMKYSRTLRPELMSEEDMYKAALAISRKRQEKARKLLFNYLNTHIEGWWC